MMKKVDAYVFKCVFVFLELCADFLCRLRQIVINFYKIQHIKLLLVVLTGLGAQAIIF